MGTGKRSKEKKLYICVHIGRYAMDSGRKASRKSEVPPRLLTWLQGWQFFCHLVEVNTRIAVILTGLFTLKVALVPFVRDLENLVVVSLISGRFSQNY